MKLTKYVTVYILQGNYGEGWTDLTGGADRKEVRADRKDYDANEPYPHRIIRRRILRTEFEAGNF
jgi:hypothetical protein